MQKYCSDCGKELIENADFCVRCGKAINKIQNQSQNKKKKKPAWLIVIGCIILIIGIFSTLSSFMDYVSTDENSKTEKFTIVEGTEKGYADSANIFYYIEGTIKNNTDKTYSYLQVTYNVYDSEGNNLGTCLANNNNVEANDTWKFKAICSGETKNISSYKLAEITGW